MKPEREQKPPRPDLHERNRRFDATPVVLVAGLGVAAVSLFAVWSLVAGGIKIDLDWESFRAAEEEPGVAVTATPQPTVQVTPSPTPGLPTVNGSPLSLSNLETAWKGKSLTMFSEGAAPGFSGQAVVPNSVRARRGAESAQLAVLIYPSSNVTKQDWNLSSGSAPSPTDGRTVPGRESVWWNQNVVVILISGDAAVATDVKAAFLGL